MNDDEMNYIQACLEFAAQLGQIARQTHEWLATANSIFFYFLSF